MLKPNTDNINNNTPYIPILYHGIPSAVCNKLEGVSSTLCIMLGAVEKSDKIEFSAEEAAFSAEETAFSAEEKAFLAESINDFGFPT